MYQRPEIVSNMPPLNIIIIGLYKYHTTTPRPLVLEDPPDHTTDKYIPNIGTQEEYSTSNGSIPLILFISHRFWHYSDLSLRRYNLKFHQSLIL